MVEVSHFGSIMGRSEADDEASVTVPRDRGATNAERIVAYW